MDSVIIFFFFPGLFLPKYFGFGLFEQQKKQGKCLNTHLAKKIRFYFILNVI